MPEANKMVVDDPNDIFFTLTMSMSLGQWKRLAEQLHEEYRLCFPRL